MFIDEELSSIVYNQVTSKPLLGEEKGLRYHFTYTSRMVPRLTQNLQQLMRFLIMKIPQIIGAVLYSAFLLYISFPYHVNLHYT